MHRIPETMEHRGVSVIDAVAHWARVRGERPAITFLTFSGRERREEVISYRSLQDRIEAFAAALEAVSAPGDRVAILMGQGIDYLVAFLGCLRAGRMAVPLYGADGYQSKDRVESVLRDASPSVAVVDRGRESSLGDGGRPGMTVLTHDQEVPQGTPQGSQRAPGEAGYLQYTSGSTREPAGVMVTMENLAHGSSQLRAALGIGPDTTIVTWLPYFHDMGLLLAAGAALQGGAHGVHLSPFSFVQQPVRWLRAISDFSASTTVVPNFALDLAVDRVPVRAREGLDLSSLDTLGNGSEPVREMSLRAFTEAYEPYGFRHRSHAPGYGLAEATLTVTTVRCGEEPRVLHVDRDRLAEGMAVPVAPDAESVVPLVSNGPPVEQEVRIVDQDAGTVLPDGAVGEVWIRGGNVCLGYHRRPEQTQDAFGGVLEGEPGRWLRSGDLGTMQDGELYVVGRIKDLIIVAGKNHYPTDIEATVLDHVPEVRANGVAVFAHEGEAPVAVVEIDPKKSRGSDLADVSQRVRSAVTRHHELSMYDIALVRPGAIPKTTSGKIQRRASATLYAQGGFKEKELQSV